MGEASWVETEAGGQVPGVLGQVINGSLKQGGEQSGGGNQAWLPGAVFLNSILSLTLSILNVCYLQGGLFTGICFSYPKNLKLVDEISGRGKERKIM